MAAAADLLQQPLSAKVVGESVKVVAVERQGNDGRGLVAQVRRRGRSRLVSLADVEAEAGSPLADLIDRYRARLGLDTAAQPKGNEIEPGSELELVVRAVKDRAASCSVLEGGQPVTLRASGIWELVPGEIATVRVKKRWLHAGTSYLSGEVEASRLDVARLGLKPLKLEPHGNWDPAEEYWGEEGDPLPEWAEPIVARGPRSEFEMEQVIPGADPANWDTDPIVEASELNQGGDHAGARALLMRELREDLRCLDAHAHLGNHILDLRPKEALRHYEVGIRIGELSLGARFDGVLPWGLIDNRPFLRCLHGYGLALWRLGRSAEAKANFERMLWLNPSDNQGARFLVDALEAGMTYEAFSAEEDKAEQAMHARVTASRKQLPVDMDELSFALEDHEREHSWYLDKETGDILLVQEDGDDDLLPVSRDELEDASRFVVVEPEETQVAYRDMEEFIATVSRARFRERLEDAIGEKGAFGRFKQVLGDEPPERERWFAFRKARLEVRARQWLARQGIEPVPRKPE